MHPHPEDEDDDEEFNPEYVETILSELKQYHRGELETYSLEEIGRIFNIRKFNTENKT